MSRVGFAVGFGVGVVGNLVTAFSLVDGQIRQITTGKLLPHSRGSS